MSRYESKIMGQKGGPENARHKLGTPMGFAVNIGPVHL